ncbi:hypothetical protein COV16_06400 [Candidatus Woesearchaeota archaeon CG10_big_fil_rev_8_21_14_0_10_34_8]|nr:MAG: hypothetical protein COV16_06400 [Candidatus Woesearchaeota archaeon CG10_big_fil_rev_8_21_14_0_10_34_8]
MNKKRKDFYEREEACPDYPHCKIIDGDKYCCFGLIKSCMYQDFDPKTKEREKKYPCKCTRKCKWNRNNYIKEI